MKTILLLAGAGLVVVLSGCGEAKERSSAEPTEVVAAEPQAATETAPVVLKRPEVSLEDCPEALGPVFGFDGNTDYLSRRALVREQSRSLSAEEVEALFAYLYLRPAEVGLKESSYDALGDQVLELLEKQVTLPEAFADHLMAVFRDRTRRLNWRDYCLQHLGTAYNRMDASQQVAVRQVFAEAAQEEASIAGTALLAMRNAGLHEEWIAGEAVAVLANAEVPYSAKIPALHTLADGRPHQALPQARDWMISEEPVHLRMAAIAVVGRLGDGQDRAALESLTGSPDIRLRESSKAALKKVDARLLGDEES